MNGRCFHFEREDDEGNCEYKLSLARASAERVRHLVTQLLFRLNEGGGRALYRVGVRDDGTAEGLGEGELRMSLRTLREMAQTLGARVAECRLSAGAKGLVAEVRVEALCQNGDHMDDVAFTRWVDAGTSKHDLATLSIPRSGSSRLTAYRGRRRRRQLSEGNLRDAREETVIDCDDDCTRGDVRRARVCVIGANNAGKSTLIGVLATGALDNGRGLARATVLRHGHEVLASGTTSAIAEIAALPPANCVLVDLAGHEKYLKTTIFGLTARSPDAALLVIDARDATLRRMTLEHLGVALALKLRVLVALTHVDVLPDDVDKCRAIERVINLLGKQGARQDVFVVSSVTGEGYEDLRCALDALPARDECPVDALRTPSTPNDHTLDNNRLIVHIHGARLVDSAGTVVFGNVHDGVVSAGDDLLLGPVSDGTDCWRKVVIKSIRLSPDDKPVFTVSAGQSATFALGDDCNDLVQETPKGVFFKTGYSPSYTRRRAPCGMVLIDGRCPPPPPKLHFDAVLLVLCAPNQRKGLHARFQSVVHAHSVRQAACITHVHDHVDLKAGTRARCSFKFLYHPEFLLPGTILILRDGRTRAVGTVLSTCTKVD